MNEDSSHSINPCKIVKQRRKQGRIGFLTLPVSLTYDCLWSVTATEPGKLIRCIATGWSVMSGV